MLFNGEPVTSSPERARELQEIVDILKDGSPDMMFAVHKLIHQMEGKKFALLRLRIVGDTPLLVHRTSGRVLAEIAGEIPRPYWDGDIERQHEAAAVAAGMIAKH